MKKTYSEMLQHSTFEDRLSYLALNGSVGIDTFGFDRYMNQRFYKSREWRRLRNDIILRDNGCDLGVDGYEIFGKVLIHHINPIGPDDIKHSTDLLFDPDNLICVTHETHNAIHYGGNPSIPKLSVERHRGDTKLW